MKGPCATDSKACIDFFWNLLFKALGLSWMKAWGSGIPGFLTSPCAFDDRYVYPDSLTRWRPLSKDINGYLSCGPCWEPRIGCKRPWRLPHLINRNLRLLLPFPLFPDHFLLFSDEQFAFHKGNVLILLWKLERPLSPLSFWSVVIVWIFLRNGRLPYHYRILARGPNDPLSNPLPIELILLCHFLFSSVISA